MRFPRIRARSASAYAFLAASGRCGPGQPEAERVQVRNKAAPHVAGKDRDAAFFHKGAQFLSGPGVTGAAARHHNGPFSLAQQGDGFFHPARVHGPGLHHCLVPGALPARMALPSTSQGSSRKTGPGPAGQGHAEGCFHIFGHPLGLGADIGGLDDRRGDGRLGGVLKVHLVPVVRARGPGDDQQGRAIGGRLLPRAKCSW